MFSYCFPQLKSWLEKLAPETASVTEGRVRNRIQTIFKSCSHLTTADCHHFLDEVYDFDALSTPLAALGLTRRHLTGMDRFDRPPQPMITNKVVFALENFKSQVRETSAFVTRWLPHLCAPCKDLTAKHLKFKVEKIVKTIIMKFISIAPTSTFGSSRRLNIQSKFYTI